MAEPATRYAQTRKRLNPWVIALIAVIHLGLFYLLARALAPSAVDGVEQSVVSAFTVTVSAPEELSEPPEPEPEGAQGDPGREAVPDAVTAPPQPVRRDPPAPRASRSPPSHRARPPPATAPTLVSSGRKRAATTGQCGLVTTCDPKRRGIKPCAENRSPSSWPNRLDQALATRAARPDAADASTPWPLGKARCRAAKRMRRVYP